MASGNRASSRRMILDQLGDLGFTEQVNLLMKQLDFKLSLRVDAVVGLRGGAVDRRLSVLAHHYEWCRIGCLKRQRQIE